MASKGGGRTVNKISVPVTTDVSGFSAGLAKAKAQSKAFVGQLDTGFKQIKGTVLATGSALAKMGSKGTRELASGLEAAKNGAVGLALSLTAAGAGLATKGFLNASNINDAATSLGLASDKLTEYRFVANAAGVSTQDLEGFLGALSANIHGSVGQINATSEALRRMGLDARTLSGLSLDKQFDALRQGMATLPDAASRAQAALAIGGEAGAKLARYFNLSGEAIDSLKSKAKGLGAIVKPEDMEKALAFNNAWFQIGATVDGLANKLSSALGPTLAAVANQFTDWFASLDSDGMFFKNIIDGMVGGFARLIDAGVAFKISFQAALADIGLRLRDIIEEMGHFVEALEGWVPAADRIGKALLDSSRSLGKFSMEQKLAAREAQRAFDTAKPGQAILDGYNKLGEAAEKNAKSIVKMAEATNQAVAANRPLIDEVLKLKQAFSERIADAGLTDEQKSIADLQRRGASLADLTQLRQQSGQAREAGRRDSLGEELRESTKTPMQKLGEDLARIDALVRQGRITQSQAVLGAAQKTRDAGLAGTPVQFAGAVEARSIEGRSQLLAATLGRPESAIETAKKGLDLTMQSNSFLARIARTLEQNTRPDEMVTY